MKISLCIPMYNEEAIVSETVDMLTDYMNNRFGKDYEILLINDGSSDRTEILARKCAEKYEGVKVIGYTPNRGKGYAVRAGVTAASGEVVMFTDCDLAYGTDVIGEFYEALKKDPECDVAVGSRKIHPRGYEGYSFIRKLASKTYRLLLRLFFGLTLSDSQCGCKAFRKRAADAIFSHCKIDRFAFDYEAILVGQKAGARFCEIPVYIVNHRKSSIHLFRDTVRMLRDLSKMKKRIKKEDINLIR